jgi:glycosyltransferase involved in cell wall biosynthesis
MTVRLTAPSKTDRPKWLVIGPVPPPIDGQSKITAAVVGILREHLCDVEIANTARKGLSRNIRAQLARVVELGRLFAILFRHMFRPARIYFSLSESVLGNLKDILIYILFFPRLRDVTAHMLGGSGMHSLLHERRALSWINNFFLRRLGGVIVEGNRGVEIFRNSVSQDRMHVIKNFADDCFFKSLHFPDSKFLQPESIKIVFMSNLIIEKGYLDLLDGYERLPKDLRCLFELIFVGSFPEESQRRDFLARIDALPGTRYMGRFIDGPAKVELLRSAQIFALPTYYPFEGQPISILEAYAAGCCVLTTLHAGIGDVFSPNKNGVEVRIRDPDSISLGLSWVAAHPGAVEEMGRYNHKSAIERFRASRFNSEIAEVLGC